MAAAHPRPGKVARETTEDMARMFCEGFKLLVCLSFVFPINTNKNIQGNLDY